MGNISYEFKTKSQAVYTAIREMITSGEHGPDEIFNSVDLAKKFGVSRTPVTEAVKMLEAKGFVTVLPGVGFKIRKPSTMEILELLEIRCALELLAIRRAVRLRCQKDVANLENILNKIKNCVKTEEMDEYLRLNEEFHFALYDLSRYNHLIQLQRDLWDWEGWYANELYDTPHDIEVLLEDHYKIVKCLKDRAIEESEKVAHEHWRHCVEVLQKKIK
ncbi:MAG: GntR family transcriptional regulator [Zhaonellaceae bacterium]|jgi:DNA-binding GntR family transcriptional regulator|nr:GntR family transcriptional regulator [Clostridia bacterium]